MTKSHIEGKLETVKFSERRKIYHDALPRLLDLAEKEDLLHHFPVYVGELTLLRAITLIDAFKKVLDISGHIAEVGVHKGFGSLLFGKLLQIYAPNSLDMVHGFDWFKGINETTDSSLQVAGGDASDESKLREVIRLQNLDNVVKIHNLNVETDLPDFFDNNSHLRFKLIFLDSGTYDVTSSSIKALWPRLNIGGILLFDQYNNEVAPGETKSIHDLLPNQIIRSFGGWMPNSYIIKQ